LSTRIWYNKAAAVERAVPELPISQQNLKVQETAAQKANRNCNQWLSSEARNFSGSTETVENPVYWWHAKEDN